MDVYFGIWIPSINPDVFILRPDYTFQLHPMGIVPWKSNTTGPIDENLFGDIPASTFPAGTYYLYLAVTPAGNFFDSYYIWVTELQITPSGEVIVEAEGTIGPDGGVVEVTDSNSKIFGAKVEISPKTLDSDTPVSIRYIDTTATITGATTVGSAIDFGPDGTAFSKDAVLYIHYDESLLPEGSSESDIFVCFLDGNQWVPAGTEDIDTLNNLIKIRTSHFTIFKPFHWLAGYRSPKIESFTASPTSYNVIVSDDIKDDLIFSVKVIDRDGMNNINPDKCYITLTLYNLLDILPSAIVDEYKALWIDAINSYAKIDLSFVEELFDDRSLSKEVVMMLHDDADPNHGDNDAGDGIYSCKLSVNFLREILFNEDIEDVNDTITRFAAQAHIEDLQGLKVASEKINVNLRTNGYIKFNSALISPSDTDVTSGTPIFTWSVASFPDPNVSGSKLWPSDVTLYIDDDPNPFEDSIWDYGTRIVVSEPCDAGCDVCAGGEGPLYACPTYPCDLLRNYSCELITALPLGTYYWGVTTADSIDFVQLLLDMIDTMDSVNSGDILIPDEDETGNPITKSGVYMFKVGSAPDTVITVSPSENVAHYQKMDFAWIGSDDVSVKGYWYWQSYRTIKKWTTNTSTTLTAPPTNGTHTFYVQAEDNQGIVDPTPAEASFIVGSYYTPPTTTIISPSDGASFNVGDTITFQGSGSDTDGSVVSYKWDFGDGSSTSTVQNPSHAYSSAGTYTVTLTVEDDDRATGTDSISVTVVSPSPTGLTATAVCSSQIDLSWNVSANNAGVAGYKIYRDGFYLDSVTSTSYSDTGLSPDTRYCYTVSAYNEANNESGESNQSCARTHALPSTSNLAWKYYVNPSNINFVSSITGEVIIKEKWGNIYRIGYDITVKMALSDVSIDVGGWPTTVVDKIDDKTYRIKNSDCDGILGYTIEGHDEIPLFGVSNGFGGAMVAIVLF